MQTPATRMAKAWDNGYGDGLGNRPFALDPYNEPDTQRCYRQGYEFGQSRQWSEAKRNRSSWDDRIHEYPLSDHDMTAIAEILDDVINRDEYHDTDHLRDLRSYLFED